MKLNLLKAYPSGPNQLESWEWEPCASFNRNHQNGNRKEAHNIKVTIVQKY